MTTAGSATIAAPELYPPRVAPPLRPLPLPVYLARFVVNPLRTIPQPVYEQPLVRQGDDDARLVWVTDPTLVEQILLGEAKTFAKTPIEKHVLGQLLGSGILIAEDQHWRWQRKTVATLFRHSELLAYVPAIAAAAKHQLAEWRRRPGQHTVDIEGGMTDVTLAVITTTILAGCDPAETAILKHTSEAFLAHISWPIAYRMVRLPLWLWHPGKARMAHSAADQRAAVARLIARRRTEAGAREDILAKLLKARHPDTGEPMADELLIDNLATFLAAGHETTAKALTWTLYILARAPEWQDRVRAEVASVAGSGPIAPEHVARLELTQRVLKEAMRLYPPAPVLSRIATDWVTLGEHRIAPGVVVIIPIYAVHRHLKLWSEPDRFDPDRFLPAREAAYSRMQYMPFGFGARSCIGSAFAMIEATVLLAELVRGARFDWDGKHEPEPISRVTLRPKGGMPLLVEALG